MLGKGDYFKLQEGPNKVRLMSDCLEHPGEYNGKPTFKWLCYVLDRKDGRIKPFFVAHTIYKAIEALQSDEDYKFDEVPMPYDITINAVGAGTKEVDYTVVRRPASPLTPAERALLTGTQPITELQKALNTEKDGAAPKAENNQTDAHADSEFPGISVDDIPA